MTREEFALLLQDVENRGRSVAGFCVAPYIYYGVDAVDDSGNRWPLEGYATESDAAEAKERYTRWRDAEEEGGLDG